MDTIRFDAEGREYIAAELAQCEQTQSWAPTSTRSGWTDELQALLEAIDADDDQAVRQAVEAAQAEAFRLAEVIARRMADLHEITERVVDDLPAGTDWESITTTADLVRLCREHGVTVDDSVMGERDGVTITATEATAYASVRHLWDGSAPYVTVDLVTGETRHIA